MRRNRHLLLLRAAIASLTLMSACSVDEGPSAGVATSTTAPSTIAATTSTLVDSDPAGATSTPISATTTTITTAANPSSTTPITTSTTTTTLVAPGLALRPDGVGTVRFGTAIVPVIDGLVALIGDPISDAAWEYPIETDDGRTDAFGDFAFPFPFGRQTCFANEFCVEAGGPTADEMTFVGWSQSEGDGALVSTLGVTIGSVWADHVRVMSVDEGGCLSFGTGASGGIDLQLQSSGALFSIPDGAGGYTFGDPDPSNVTVVGLLAGDLRTFLHGDC